MALWQNYEVVKVKVKLAMGPTHWQDIQVIMQGKRSWIQRKNLFVSERNIWLSIPVFIHTESNAEALVGKHHYYPTTHHWWLEFGFFRSFMVKPKDFPIKLWKKKKKKECESVNKICSYIREANNKSDLNSSAVSPINLSVLYENQSDKLSNYSMESITNLPSPMSWIHVHA